MSKTFWSTTSVLSLQTQKHQGFPGQGRHICTPLQHLDISLKWQACVSCIACRDLCKRTSTFVSHTTAKKYDIKQFSTCNSSNVICLMSCPWGLQYIDKTTRQVKARIIEHKSEIRKGDEKSSIACHIKDANHSFSSLTFCVIQQIKTPHRGGDTERLPLQSVNRYSTSKLYIL